MDHYDVLGCTKDSTFEDIKRAYHALALKFHPDKNPSELNNIKFQHILEAWNVLREPKSREEYDTMQKQVELDSECIPVYARIHVNELEIENDDEATLIYRCRCGGLYCVERKYVQKKDQSIHVPCLECTFLIIVDT
uniref:dnaJ homolog subfamily C member 24-like isoform X2 n=1 Tax=Osmia lignaria TaxID=473952 RepID=UPI001478EA33|nr:dnaJ homolog subfamily C member 24-like isoform X2 [Osmia lignaria]XP_034195562.1 dnaJ homolog subfamily C member 24-like isoform X2 [Osmia lignaria]